MRFTPPSHPKDQQDHLNPLECRTGDCPPRETFGDVRASAKPPRWTFPPEHVRPFADILECAKAGARTEVGLLYHRYLPVVYRYTLARVGDVHAAEDLTSETFMAMMRSIRDTRAKDELGFAAWLLGIARNRVLMYFRQRKVHPEVELQPQWWGESQSIAEEDDPLLVLTARETWQETVAAFKQLTREQQEVLLYRCVLGYSTDEVAEMMNRRTGTIRALQFRALTSLTRLLNADATRDTSRKGRRHVSW